MDTLHDLALKGGAMQKWCQGVQADKVEVHELHAQFFVREYVLGLLDMSRCEFPLEGVGIKTYVV